MTESINWNKLKIGYKRILLDKYIEKKLEDGVLCEEEINKSRFVVKYLESELKNNQIIFENNEIKDIIGLNINNGVLYYDKKYDKNKKKVKHNFK